MAADVSTEDVQAFLEVVDDTVGGEGGVVGGVAGGKPSIAPTSFHHCVPENITLPSLF